VERLVRVTMAGLRPGWPARASSSNNATHSARLSEHGYPPNSPMRVGLCGSRYPELSAGAPLVGEMAAKAQPEDRERCMAGDQRQDGECARTGGGRPPTPCPQATPGGHGGAAERDVDTDNDGHDRQTDSCAAGPGRAGWVLSGPRTRLPSGMVVELGSVAARPVTLSTSPVRSASCSRPGRG